MDKKSKHQQRRERQRERRVNDRLNTLKPAGVLDPTFFVATMSLESGGRYLDDSGGFISGKNITWRSFNE